MRKNLMLLASVAAIALAPVSALAIGTVPGAAGGAVTGAIVGGPVGAAVGGVLGAILGTAIDPPPEQVVAYVQTEAPPPPPVVLQGNLVVGATLPPEVVLYPVPSDVYVHSDGRAYAYAIVNDQRVVVDPETRAVIAIAE